jgi:phosphotransferase system enzyme I (PtsI)
MGTELGKGNMLTLVGEGVSPGLAKGKAFVYIDVLKRDSTLYRIDDSQVGEEKARIDKAIDDVRQSLTIDAKQIEGQLGKGSAAIFLAQKTMLLDPSVVDELKRNLEAERINAEQVVKTVFGLLAGRFRKLSDEALRERGDDIDDLSRRLLLALAGIHAHSLESLPANTVLVARQLLPSDTVFVSRSTTVAVIAEFAGRAAHAALLARELGIPCVGGVPRLLERVHTGDVVLADGSEGKAVINPDSRTLQRYEDALSEVRERSELQAQGRHVGRAVTLDGIEVSVMANVRSRDDVELAMRRGGDGIGLFRTEPFFLSTKHFPSDREFGAFLMDSLRLARGKHIDVRLLDIGADKTPIYLHLPPEADPFLGQRGVRVLLEYPDLLDAQLRAVLRISRQFPIGVLIPMVTTESDVVQVAERLHRLADEMSIRVLPRLGAMVETPAAALSISSLKKHVDFFSIGSNDLTQYTMAAGRENPGVSQYFVDDHRAVLQLIEFAVEASGDTPISLCGELAGRIDAMPSILRSGLRSLSVAASLVPDVKDGIRNLCFKGLEHE